MNSSRDYRQVTPASRLSFFSLKVKETDLWIGVNSDELTDGFLKSTEKFVWKLRKQVELYIDKHPVFRTTLEPVLIDPEAPECILSMIRAANQPRVGPMAAVAGMIAETVGHYLLKFYPEVIVENGGDIFIQVNQPAKVGIYAGSSPLSGKLALRIDPSKTPLGVCTSSGTVGPSLSMGKADAAVAISASVPLADAAATAIGNLVKTAKDMTAAMEFAQNIKGIDGAAIIFGDRFTAWGEIEFALL